MARTHTFRTNKAIGSALRNIETGKVSRFLALQLVEKGFAKVEQVHADHVGRPAHKYVLTGKGKFAKNWGGKTENLITGAAPVATGTALVLYRG